MRHELTNIDTVNRTAICSVDGAVRIAVREKDKWRCRERKIQYKKPYRAHRGGVCEKCGFEPEHPCQLDVDHRDGNHENNDPSNLQTLCANCHRLKTWYERIGKKDA